MSKKVWSFVIVIVLLLYMIVLSAVTGSLKIGMLDFVRGLFTGGNETVEVIKDLRLPRLIVALFAGACLAVSGALLQAVMRNPLADAGVIGIASGANFFPTVMIVLLPQLYYWSPLFAFLGGALACFLVYTLSWKSGLSPIRIVLVGIAVNAMFTGLNEAFVISCSYLMGTNPDASVSSNISMETWKDVQMISTYGSIGLVISVMLITWCNMLALQDKTAANLGLRVTRARIVISAAAVLLAGVATAVAGVISFVGLLIPHIARQLVGSDYKAVIPFSALLGALLILTADTLGRTVVAPLEIPASTIMAVIGGPFLIFMLRKGDRVYGN
ncbi:iron ABC transporter permease [Paenibacillus sp. P96]|uniref:Probable heme-iron transport system permease protein IsdF n=1 Tax=Paenibacillus zeirhizosphaerae TaxID=2987519 RepID=A0ABT9FR22_9BACL|nr:iron ABC transporter permease [Paenibacillus sp. P96]MDP4097169.1 iron ABC transporter permease [Paenibacillus sp. P96]